MCQPIQTCQLAKTKVDARQFLTLPSSVVPLTNTMVMGLQTPSVISVRVEESDCWRAWRTGAAKLEAMKGTRLRCENLMMVVDS
jgi:hypothetical protein